MAITNPGDQKIETRAAQASSVYDWLRLAGSDLDWPSVMETELAGFRYMARDAYAYVNGERLERPDIATHYLEALQSEHAQIAVDVIRYLNGEYGALLCYENTPYAAVQALDGKIRALHMKDTRWGKCCYLTLSDVLLALGEGGDCFLEIELCIDKLSQWGFFTDEEVWAMTAERSAVQGLLYGENGLFRRGEDPDTDNVPCLNVDPNITQYCLDKCSDFQKRFQ